MKKILFLLIILSLSVYNLDAQDVIRGVVVDAQTGKTIPGVNVSAKSGKIGTVTDVDGNFILNTKEDSLKLRFSSVGYQTKYLVLKKGENKKVKIQPASVSISQIYVHNSTENAMQSISKIDLRLKPVNTSQEILRIIPGLFIAQHEGGGKAEQIFLRGFDMDHGTDISVNVDGMPVNMVSQAHGQGYADLHFLIPETVDNIEFEKGTYNPEYGDFETGAYINFHTKNYLKHNRIQLEYGMFNTKRLLAMFNLFGKDNTKQSAYIATEYMLTDGFFDLNQNFNRLNTFFKYQNHLDKKNLLTIEANIFKTRWDAAGLIPLRAVKEKIIDRFGTLDSCGGGQTHRNDLIFRLSSQLSDNANITNMFYFTDYAFDLHSNFTFFLHDTINGDQIRQSESRKVYGYKFVYSQKNSFNNWNFLTKAGVGLRYDDINNLALSHTKDRDSIIKRIELGDVDETNFYGFFNEIINRGQWLLKIGARVDNFDFIYVNKLLPKYKVANYSKTVFSPKMTIAYSANSTLQIYLKAGEGFHSNDARMIGETSNDILPKAYGSDLGLIVKPTDNVIFNLAFWALYLEQEYVYSGDEGGIEACGKTFRKGVDFSSHLQFTDWLFAKVDLNYAVPRNIDVSDGGIYIPLAPVFSSVGGIYFSHSSGINGSLTYRYLGKRPADEYYKLATSPYTVVDASLNYTTKKFELGFSIENLLNTPWRDAQFETTTRLRNEKLPVTDIDFTPGTPFALKARLALFF